MPYGFVHRDYQSKNLMVGPTGGLTLIDFQDALLGPRAYDLVALLCDSYVSLDVELQESMIERYAALRRIDLATLRLEFWHVALHRKLKDAGRFIYIDRVRKNPDFLQWFPQSLVYVGRALGQAPGFEALDRLLREAIPGFPDAVPQPASAME
jgi:aminoglycoside/choline kinase family phosphotransferase